MRTWENVPPTPSLEQFLQQTGELQEVFGHSMFVNGTPAERDLIMMKSSTAKYESEKAYPWDQYFGLDLRPMLHGRTALDLGCFTGGRSIAWLERYELAKLNGIDVDPVFIEAANRFAATRHAPAEFRLGFGENLPFPDASFDAVLSFDVFEHVQDPPRALAECRRVLKPGGRLYVVFPSRYHPKEHHLGLVTRALGIHWFFSPRTLIRAYDEIIAERGEPAQWYRRRSPEPFPWERGQTTNGTTMGGFLRLVREQSWTVVLHSRKPVGSIGRSVSRRPAAALVSRGLGLLTDVPGLRELALHRITMVLEKPV